jgi:hypothetical protein
MIKFDSNDRVVWYDDTRAAVQDTTMTFMSHWNYVNQDLNPVNHAENRWDWEKRSELIDGVPKNIEQAKKKL